MSDFLRAFPLEDISVRSDREGRIVTAYAAVFDRAVPIRDHQGEYMEVIAQGAFRKTIAERGTNFGVFYNHARGIHGQPSDLFSLPLGTPISVREDAVGVITETRYNMNPLTEQVLESIQNGDIRGQSFSGSFVLSNPTLKRGSQFRRDSDGSLETVTRTEIAMREYGPTPFPAYNEAAILGVRAMLSNLLTREQLEELLALTPRAEASSASNEPDPQGHHSERRTWTPEQIARRNIILGREVKQ